ncbi:cyclase family protein [Pleomorphovibrio marinus]|uniref:cyclase family protein n=1 Tax=Pleomorphovibrio marinus TaxID=2164132 RepID=UPI000E0B1359|nr:cyclase family protein [Pleomorphovibrio marinus]
MEWIDLTQTVSSEMPGIAIRAAKTLEKDGWNARTVELYTHAGTHADAPVHFGMPGPSIDEMPLDKLIGECWVVNIEDIKEKELITLSHLGGIAEQFREGEGLLLKSGWSKLAISNPKKFRDELPRISEELAKWCVERQVKMLLVEAPSVADVNNLEEVTRIHRVLFGGKVFIVEGVCNTAALTTPKVEVIVMPLKLKDGDGAPARVIARTINP